MNRRQPSWMNWRIALISNRRFFMSLGARMDCRRFTIAAVKNYLQNHLPE